MGFLEGNAFFNLIAQSDSMTKFVLLILLFMSILCWTVFFYKIVMFRIKKRQLKEALNYLKKVHNLDDLRTMAAAFSHTLPGYVVAKNLSFLKSLLEVKESLMPLSEHELELLMQHVEQTIEEVLYQEESYLPILSGSAAAAPLLGLFGTVWGLVHSFIRISETQQADIATIAPGIAEALITTLVGLLVAIPALLMFHYLNTQVRSFEHKLFNLADKLSWLVQMLFIKR
ncbi:MAG: MotA/TolQ/ExbB proton channel family protein [Candidatus Babeliales bacterium]